MMQTILVASTLVVSNAFVANRMPVRSMPALNADIVDTAVGAGSFGTLAAALTAAGLVPTLKSAGPFTVFAPTDDAFAKLPAGTVDSLLKDIPALTNILTYHVVPGKVMAETVVTLNNKKVKTVNGAEVTVTVGPEGVKVDNAKVVTTDIACDNGVIHVIDSVIIPKPAAAKAVAFDPKKEAGVSGPFGFFDPLGICPSDKKGFMKFRENELKHGRLAMIAVLGVIVGESGLNFFGNDISGPAIYQYQQAEILFNAWSANVVGFVLAIEGFNIVNGWQGIDETMESSVGIAGLKDGYVSGDLKFDPLGLKPATPAALKTIQTKEINNGRLAMLAIAGIVAQELVTGAKIF
mmetsp:Transcript_29285/g.28026  ORF Transcript_29285/g.28026 Transcript_29285/m.28026 type:complete len:350 (+) Transcript_29285:81-1130(+)